MRDEDCWDMTLLELMSDFMPNLKHFTANPKQVHLHFTKSGWHDGWIIQLEWHGPGYVEGGRQLPKDHITEYAGTVVVVFTGVLHETEAIDVTHVGLAVSSQEVKATNCLFEGGTDLPGDEFLMVWEDDWVADLLTLTVSLYFTVQRGGLTGLRVGVVGTHCVHLKEMNLGLVLWNLLVSKIFSFIFNIDSNHNQAHI